MTKKIELIGVHSDIGAGKRGAGFGPLVLLKSLESQKIRTYFDLLRKTCITPAINNGYTTNHARHVETILNTCNQVCYDVSNSILTGNRPVIISGDHSNAAGTIAGIKNAKPNSVLGVIWIDAHADLHSPYTTPSGNMHGMPLAASIAEDNKECAIREINSATFLFWKKFKNMGGLSHKVFPENIIYVSLRDYEKEEAHLIAKYGVRSFNTCSLLNFGTEKVASCIIDQLNHCTDIYVSFDVDSLDSSISKGTGLPVRGGLMSWEAELLISLLLSNPKVSCFEITEFNPFLDLNKETAGIVSNILRIGIESMQNEKISTYYFSKKLAIANV